MSADITGKIVDVEIKEAVKDYAIAVSYTHLDVYKRQYTYI